MEAPFGKSVLLPADTSAAVGVDGAVGVVEDLGGADADSARRAVPHQTTFALVHHLGRS